MLASFWLRGRSADGRSPGVVEFLFERSTDPWTKSVFQTVAAPTDGGWKRAIVAFEAAESYAPSEAMASIRFAQQPQTVEVADLVVLDYGSSTTVEKLQAFAAEAHPLGRVSVALDRTKRLQTMRGLGGNFCQPRYGSTEPMDAVGRYVLDHLRVAHARIGLPLNHWTPVEGSFQDDAQAKATFLALQEMKRRGIPSMVSVWEGPQWMLGGRAEQSGRTLRPEMVPRCIEAIAQYLVVARDRYGVEVPFFSFNEPDYGVNFKFTPHQMVDFIRAAGKRFKELGLKTKFIVADTANGANLHDYAKPILEEASIAEFLGPIGFHSWDGLGAPEAAYRKIAELGRRHNKEVWCLEAGWDAQLWQQRNPWGSWTNALQLARVYVRTVRLTGATLMDYWTYQDNYPLVDQQGSRPYPSFAVIRQLEGVLAPGSSVVSCSSPNEELQALATVGPAANRLGIVLANSAGKGVVNLSGLPPRVDVTVETSDSAGQRRSTKARTDSAGRLSIAMPARSVVTAVVRP